MDAEPYQEAPAKPRPKCERYYGASMTDMLDFIQHVMKIMERIDRNVRAGLEMSGDAESHRPFYYIRHNLGWILEQGRKILDPRGTRDSGPRRVSTVDMLKEFARKYTNVTQQMDLMATLQATLQNGTIVRHREFDPKFMTIDSIAGPGQDPLMSPDRDPAIFKVSKPCGGRAVNYDPAFRPMPASVTGDKIKAACEAAQNTSPCRHENPAHTPYDHDKPKVGNVVYRYGSPATAGTVISIGPKSGSFVNRTVLTVQKMDGKTYTEEAYGLNCYLTLIQDHERKARKFRDIHYAIANTPCLKSKPPEPTPTPCATPTSP